MIFNEANIKHILLDFVIWGEKLMLDSNMKNVWVRKEYAYIFHPVCAVAYTPKRVVKKEDYLTSYRSDLARQRTFIESSVQQSCP